MLLAFFLVALPVCRYTVRDIGFVDLVGSEYELSFIGADSAGLDADGRALLGVLERDGNVAFGSPAADEVKPGWWLGRDGLEPIALGVAAPGGLGAKEAWEAAIRSPVRDQFLAESLTCFAGFLRIEGPDPDEEARVDSVLEAARAGLAVLSESLPRPVDRPLVTYTVPLERLEEERVTLWALGVDPEPGSCVAVIYGRGKLAGPVMVGAEITLDEALAQLALVGESCECETSRDWFNEPRLPMAWADRQRARAAGELGFDPESPMVKSEVVRILERGPMSGEIPREGEVDGVEALVFGYREVDLSSVGVPAPVRDFEPDGSSPSRSPGVIHEPSSGDDWGFEAGPEPEPDTAKPAVAGADAPSDEGQGLTLRLVMVGLLAFLGLGIVAGGLVGVVGRRGQG